MNSNALKNLVGKKFVCWIYDENEDRTYMFFDDLEAIAVENIIPIEAGPELAGKVIAEKIESAQQIFALQAIVDSGNAVTAPGLTVETHGADITLVEANPEAEHE